MTCEVLAVFIAADTMRGEHSHLNFCRVPVHLPRESQNTTHKFVLPSPCPRPLRSHRRPPCSTCPDTPRIPINLSHSPLPFYVLESQRKCCHAQNSHHFPTYFLHVNHGAVDHRNHGQPPPYTPSPHHLNTSDDTYYRLRSSSSSREFLGPPNLQY